MFKERRAPKELGEADSASLLPAGDDDLQLLVLLNIS